MTENAMQESERLAARLRFRHLQLITEIQRCGSLRAASQPLNLTQPALSKALREIEAAFGFTLFARTARGLTPTAQGAVVVRGAAMLLEELAHLHAEAAAGESAISLVRIGAPPFVAQDYLPAVLTRLALRKPPVRTQLTEDRVPLLLESLTAGKLDDPIRMSTWSSRVNFRANFTALVGSVASSRMMYWTSSPPSVFGNTLKVFLYGIPSEAPGPVAPVITPTLTWAIDGVHIIDSANIASAPSVSTFVFGILFLPQYEKRWLGSPL